MDNQEIIIQKYGGSSIANIERLGKVAEHIKRTRESFKTTKGAFTKFAASNSFSKKS